MVAGPELVRLTEEFELSIDGLHRRITSETRHHEQTRKFQVTFAQNAQSLVEVIEEMGNPFFEDSKDLLRLDTRDMIDPAVASSVSQAENLGKQQYETFISERLLERSVPISEPIKKNHCSVDLHLDLEKSKSSLQVASLKSDVSLFSRLYISCQSRDGDLDEFFHHENQPCPLPISPRQAQVRK